MSEQERGKNGRMLRIMITVVFVSILVLMGIYVAFFMQGSTFGSNVPVLATEYENVTAEDAYSAFSKFNDSSEDYNLIIIDARVLYKACPPCLETLFKNGHIPGAILDTELNPEVYYQDLNETSDILVYTQHDSSKTVAFCNSLVGHVYGNIYNLKDGYNAWIAADYPIETGE